MNMNTNTFGDNVKHLECAFYMSPWGCKYTSEECKYAHEQTGSRALMPRFIEGVGYVASANLQHTLDAQWDVEHSELNPAAAPFAPAGAAEPLAAVVPAVSASPVTSSPTTPTTTTTATPPPPPTPLPNILCRYALCRHAWHLIPEERRVDLDRRANMLDHLPPSIRDHYVQKKSRWLGCDWSHQLS